MIYQKGEFWAIKGFSNKYTSLEAVTEVYGKMLAKEEAVKLKADLAYKKLLDSLEPDPTPYEIMIEKNICKLCNLEPCECFTSIKKMEHGY
jgi:hypothetical protein